MKFIGYCLIGFAGAVMASEGLTINKWQTWAIMTGFIVGEFLACKGGK